MATLLEAVKEVSDIVAPGRCPVSPKGVLDPETVREINRAGRILAKEGDWADLWQNVTFNTIDHRIVLPDFVASIRAAKIGTHHQQIRSPYYFHAQTHGGVNPSSHEFGDAGNLVYEGVFPTQHDLPCATQLAVLFSEGNAGEEVTVVISGLNSSKAPVRETIVARIGGPLMISVNDYSEISSVAKTTTVGGLARVMPWNAEEGSYGFPVVTLSPWETSGQFRRYFVGGLPEGMEAEVFSLVKLGWSRNYTSPEEFLPISNFFALRSMVQALRALDNGDRRAYLELRSLAVGHMDKASNDVQKADVVEVDNRIRSRFTRNRHRGQINRGRNWRF